MRLITTIHASPEAASQCRQAGLPLPAVRVMRAAD